MEDISGSRREAATGYWSRSVAAGAFVWPCRSTESLEQMNNGFVGSMSTCFHASQKSCQESC